ncbi:MAG TPA: hypothetical protein VFJ20_10790 [Gemmatimonadaceae bacterium]|nr:hypothetical protein [Gemmatimonadaceae bacterium]
MRSTRIVPVLVAACLITSTSCSDSTAPTASSNSGANSPISQSPSYVTVSGTIHQSFTDIGEVMLKTPDGDDLVLTGAEAANLASLDGAEVDVRGLWDAGALAVSDFLVRRVGGIDVLDGIVTMQVDDETGDVHYGISLTRGADVPLIDPPDDLIAHLGQRVWVTEPTDGQPLTFGIIGQPTE